MLVLMIQNDQNVMTLVVHHRSQAEGAGGKGSTSREITTSHTKHAQRQS